jgi:hypothetical protein
MEIITGYTGQSHIEAGDVQALLRGIMGKGLYLLNSCECFEPEILDANTIKINSGDCIFQGVHCRIPYGEYDTVTIANGSGDYDRTDVIALRYEKDAETDEESVSWAYYQGGSDGEPPAVTEGNIEEGALVAEVVMFTILFDRMTPESVGGPGLTETLPEIQAMAYGAAGAVQNKANTNDVVYKPNDTVTLYYEPVCGEIYSNKKTLRYFVPFSRPLKGVTKVAITAGNYQVKANNAVIVNATALVSATKTVTLHPNGITVEITKSSGFAGSANAVCAVSGYMTVKFSA